MFVVRLVVVFAVCLFGFATPGLAQPVPSELPTETDTGRVGRAAVISNVQGQIFKKSEDGNLVPVKSRASVKPGDVLLVRKGASFSIGRTRLGPENHGDRWVQFQ